MSKQKIVNYSLEFKESSAELARSSDRSISQTAKALGINENTLHGCIMCGLLGVSRSQYYEWTTGLQSPRSLENGRLTEEITVLVVESRYRYGTRRVQRGLAKKSIFEYIEVFYNRVRMHSANNYLSPVEYERLRKTA
jgi:transposase InsO family protein